MSKKFRIYLKNGDKYLMEIGFNFHLYKIKRGFLYNGFKKLGEIDAIKTIGG